MCGNSNFINSFLVSLRHANSVRAGLCVIRLPPRRFCTECFSTLLTHRGGREKKTLSEGLKKSHRVTCFSVELSGSFFQTEPWLESARKQSSDPKCVTVPAWQDGGHLMECFRKVKGVPFATLSAPSEKWREVFPAASEIWWWNSSTCRIKDRNCHTEGREESTFIWLFISKSVLT